MATLPYPDHAYMLPTKCNPFVDEAPVLSGSTLNGAKRPRDAISAGGDPLSDELLCL